MSEHPEQVLVVEDDSTLASMVRTVLEEAGCEVQLAESAETALQLLVPGRFFGAILDINLPGMTGIDLHRRIRELDPVLARRCIFMSGERRSDARRRYFDAEAAGFLEKPFLRAALEAAFGRLLLRPGCTADSELETRAH